MRKKDEGGIINRKREREKTKGYKTNQRSYGSSSLNINIKNIKKEANKFNSENKVLFRQKLEV